jgi:hypothetical protein
MSAYFFLFIYPEMNLRIITPSICVLIILIHNIFLILKRKMKAHFLINELK